MFPLATILLLTLAFQDGSKPSPFAKKKVDPDIPVAVPPVSPVSPTGRFTAPRRPVALPAAPLAQQVYVQPVNRSIYYAPIPPAPPPPDTPPVKPAISAIPQAIPATPVLRPAPDFALTPAGTSKFEALRLLGPPVTAIQMYDDANFTESLRYEWKGNWIGTVRLINGRVARIDQP